MAQQKQYFLPLTLAGTHERRLRNRIAYLHDTTNMIWLFDGKVLDKFRLLKICLLATNRSYL